MGALLTVGLQKFLMLRVVYAKALAIIPYLVAGFRSSFYFHEPCFLSLSVSSIIKQSFLSCDLNSHMDLRIFEFQYGHLFFFPIVRTGRTTSKLFNVRVDTKTSL